MQVHFFSFDSIAGENPRSWNGAADSFHLLSESEQLSNQATVLVENVAGLSPE